MNYLTNYYKNLCEELEQRIQLLEAGLKKALKTEDPELIKKEKLKQKTRLKKHETLGTEAGIRSQAAIREKGPMSKVAAYYARKAETHAHQARGVRANIKKLDAVGPEEPDYDSDPPEAEDAQAFMRMSGQRKTPRSRGEGGGISPYYQ